MIVLLDGLQAGNRSGTGSYTEELVRWLPRVDPNLELHVLWPRTLISSTEFADSVSPIPVDNSRRFSGTFYRQWSLRKDVARIKPDVVHYLANVGPLAGGGRRAGCKTMVTIHDLTFFREPKWFRIERAAYYRFAARRAVPLADRILADSMATADDLQRYLGVSDSKIDVIHLGVDSGYSRASESRIDEIRRKYTLPKRFFLYLGTLEPRKNIVRLVQAWSRIAPRCSWDLVVAGREGWKTAPIKKAIGGTTYRTRIHLPGFIDAPDLPGLLSACSAFVWPTLWEGFGLPPLEAMACGAPVLTSNTSSLPEVVGDAALGVDPQDVQAIADGMLRLATDEDLCTRLSDAGPAHAGGFTWRTTAQRTAAAYRTAVEETGS